MGGRARAMIAGAGAAGVAAATLGRWYRRFDWTGEHDERFDVPTDDGWTLAMYRYRPRGTPRPFPVVCGHGFAGSRLIFDLGGSASLARFLADDGFDVYCVDLRGRGDSLPANGVATSSWRFDDFVLQDLPAVVAHACETASADEAFWLGMEMSGQALYAAWIRGTASRVRGAVTFGSPVLTPPDAKVPGITMPPRARLGGRVPFRAGARAAGPVLAYARARILETSFRPSNSDPLTVARYFRNGVPDESEALADDFASWIRDGAMRGADGWTYSDRLADVALPLLVMVGAADLQRPPEAVRAAFDAFGSEDRTFVRAGAADGFSTDYGHDDLLAGRAAPEEIFPLVRDWLRARSR